MPNDGAAQELPFTCCGINWSRSKLVTVTAGKESFLHIGACLKCGKARPSLTESIAELIRRMESFADVRDETKFPLSADEVRMLLAVTRTLMTKP